MSDKEINLCSAQRKLPSFCFAQIHAGFPPCILRLLDEVKMCADLDKETATLTQTLKERQEIMEKLKDLATKQKIFLDLAGSNMI